MTFEAIDMAGLALWCSGCTLIWYFIHPILRDLDRMDGR